jgi:hypothetical protein
MTHTIISDFWLELSQNYFFKNLVNLIQVSDGYTRRTDDNTIITVQCHITLITVQREMFTSVNLCTDSTLIRKNCISTTDTIRTVTEEHGRHSALVLL